MKTPANSHDPFLRQAASAFCKALLRSAVVSAWWLPSAGKVALRTARPNIRRAKALPADAVMIGSYLAGISGNQFIKDLRAAQAASAPADDPTINGSRLSVRAPSRIGANP